MTEVINSYKSSTRSAFKNPIQETISELEHNAIKDGFERDENNFKFIVSQVDENWVVVLLVFIPGKKDPQQYVDTIPVQ